MTTGDEPALGGRDDDLSPMIGSMRTRAIADARGAYATGNLKALVSLMSEPQQRQFHIALVQHAHVLAQSLLPDAPHLRPPEAQPILDVVERRLVTFLMATTEQAACGAPARANGKASAGWSRRHGRFCEVARRSPSLPGLHPAQQQASGATISPAGSTT